MLKKVLSATIVLALVSATGSVAYSDVVIDKEKPTNLGPTIEPTTEMQVNLKKQLEVYKPETGVISDKIVLLSGIAAEGSKIIVEIYSTPSISLKEFNYNPYNFGLGALSVLDTEGIEMDQDIYLPPVVKEVEVGAFGYFAEELELKFGLNKINVYIEGSEDSEVKYVYVNDYSKAEELIKKIDDMDFFNTMKQIFGQEETDEFMKLNSMPKLQLPEDETEIDNDETKDELNTENEEQENDHVEETDGASDSEDISVEDNTNEDKHEN